MFILLLILFIGFNPDIDYVEEGIILWYNTKLFNSTNRDYIFIYKFEDND